MITKQIEEEQQQQEMAENQQQQQEENENNSSNTRKRARKATVAYRPEYGNKQQPSQLVHPKEDDITAQATTWWCELRSTWRRFRPLNEDWGFIPASLSHIKMKDVKHYGVEGLHYFVGWRALYDVINKHGLEYSPTLQVPGMENTNSHNNNCNGNNHLQKETNHQEASSENEEEQEEGDGRREEITHKKEETEVSKPIEESHQPAEANVNNKNNDDAKANNIDSKDKTDDLKTNKIGIKDKANDVKNSTETKKDINNDKSSNGNEKNGNGIISNKNANINEIHKTKKNDKSSKEDGNIEMDQEEHHSQEEWHSKRKRKATNFYRPENCASAAVVSTEAAVGHGGGKTENNAGKIENNKNAGKIENSKNAGKVENNKIVSDTNAVNTFKKAKEWWKGELRSTWKRFKTSNEDWGFIPASLNEYKAKDVKKNGIEGVHYFLGWQSLYNGVHKNGLRYAPKLKIPNTETAVAAAAVAVTPKKLPQPVRQQKPNHATGNAKAAHSKDTHHKNSEKKTKQSSQEPEEEEEYDEEEEEEQAEGEEDDDDEDDDDEEEDDDYDDNEGDKDSSDEDSEKEENPVLPDSCKRQRKATNFYQPDPVDHNTITRAKKWWTQLRRNKLWKRFRPTNDADWVFFPASLSHLKMKDIIKSGTKGVHFFVGWKGLYNAVVTYGLNYAPKNLKDFPAKHKSKVASSSHTTNNALGKKSLKQRMVSEIKKQRKLATNQNIEESQAGKKQRKVTSAKSNMDEKHQEQAGAKRQRKENLLQSSPASKRRRKSTDHSGNNDESDNSPTDDGNDTVIIQFAKNWWKNELSDRSWRRSFGDWAFFPASLNKLEMKDIKKYGTEGVHFFIGWKGLYDAVKTHGFDYSPTLDVPTSMQQEGKLSLNGNNSSNKKSIEQVEAEYQLKSDSDLKNISSNMDDQGQPSQQKAAGRKNHIEEQKIPQPQIGKRQRKATDFYGHDDHSDDDNHHHHVDKEDSIIIQKSKSWWENELKERSWRRSFGDWGFYPASLNNLEFKDIKLYGSEGVHFFIGWKGLYNAIKTHGFDYSPSLDISAIQERVDAPLSKHDSKNSDADEQNSKNQQLVDGNRQKRAHKKGDQRDVIQEAKTWWFGLQRHKSWRRFRYSDEDWAFIPASLVDLKIMDIKKYGISGLHYFVGWVNLHTVIETHGSEYKPPFPMVPSMGQVETSMELEINNVEKESKEQEGELVTITQECKNVDDQHSQVGKRQRKEAGFYHVDDSVDEHEIETQAEAWWRCELSDKSWRRFKRSNEDWTFIPASLSHLKISDVQKFGSEAVHYFIGWKGLYHAISTYGLDYAPKIGLPSLLPRLATFKPQRMVIDNGHKTLQCLHEDYSKKLCTPEVDQQTPCQLKHTLMINGGEETTRNIAAETHPGAPQQQIISKKISIRNEQPISEVLQQQQQQQSNSISYFLDEWNSSKAGEGRPLNSGSVNSFTTAQAIAWWSKLCNTWRKFQPSKNKKNWGFIPASLNCYEVKEVLQYGKEGIHYFVGWDGLYDAIENRGLSYAPTLRIPPKQITPSLYSNKVIESQKGMVNTEEESSRELRGISPDSQEVSIDSPPRDAEECQRELIPTNNPQGPQPVQCADECNNLKINETNSVEEAKQEIASILQELAASKPASTQETNKLESRLKEVNTIESEIQKATTLQSKQQKPAILPRQKQVPKQQKPAALEPKRQEQVTLESELKEAIILESREGGSNLKSKQLKITAESQKLKVMSPQCAQDKANAQISQQPELKALKSKQQEMTLLETQRKEKNIVSTPQKEADDKAKLTQKVTKLEHRVNELEVLLKQSLSRIQALEKKDSVKIRI